MLTVSFISSQSLIEVPKSLMTKLKRMSKFRKVQVKLISFSKQNVSKPVTLNELTVWENCDLGRVSRRHCVRSCTHDLGKYSHIQTDLTRLIRTKYQQIVFTRTPLYSHGLWHCISVCKPWLSKKNVDLAIETGWKSASEIIQGGYSRWCIQHSGS